MRILLFLFLVVLVVGPPPLHARQGAEPYIMKIGIGNPQQKNHFGWTPFEVFKNQVERLSAGRIEVKLYSQVMGISSLEMIALVKEGVVQARDFADGHLATVYPPIQVLSIPYLFANREVAWKVLDGPFGQQLIEDMVAKTGLRPLYWLENGGFRHYSNNKRPIHSPADMIGLRIRTMESPLHIRIVSDLGGRGVPISWGQVYDAISNGLVDGQENSIGTFLIPHFERIQKYIVLDGHVYGTYTLLMNDTWYQSLPSDLQAILQQAGRLSAIANRGLCIVNEMEGIHYLQAQGVTIYKPSEKEHRLFKTLTQPSAINWLTQQIGKQWVDQALQAAVKAEQELNNAH